ncbi:Uncharacterized protein Fot_12869 [Forsythia ovata]|uniref:Uncharacterized protein n=1 Tax=Forsythia ovata TaxID=205694 RepID=A0ABD1W2C0_9LAMI
MAGKSVEVRQAAGLLLKNNLRSAFETIPPKRIYTFLSKSLSSISRKKRQRNMGKSKIKVVNNPIESKLSELGVQSWPKLLLHMEFISVLVYYDGEWDTTRTYNDYSIVGIIVPLDCSYGKLVDIIMKELKMDTTQYAVTVQYQVISNGPLIKVCSDSSVYFYIQVKKIELELTKLPLLVDIKKVACDEVNLMFLDTSHSDPSCFRKRRRMVIRNCTNQWLDNDFNPRLPTIE